MLNTLGYDIAIDGIFGPETEAAVRGFQAGDPSLGVTGIVDDATYNALTSLTQKKDNRLTRVALAGIVLATAIFWLWSLHRE